MGKNLRKYKKWKVEFHVKQILVMYFNIIIGVGSKRIVKYEFYVKVGEKNSIYSV